MLTCVKPRGGRQRSGYICVVNALKFKQIIYLITVTVVVTVAAQVYTNVQNYRVNKQRFELDVQQALDLAVETYYADRARNEIIIFTQASGFSSGSDVNGKLKFDTLSFDTVQTTSQIFKEEVAWKSYFEKRDSIHNEMIIELSTDNTVFKLDPDSISRLEIVNQYIAGDSVNLEFMAKKILASLKDGGIDFERLKGYLEKELVRKEIDVAYQLIYATPSNTYRSSEQAVDYALTSFSKSTYLPRNNTLEIRYQNASLAILKRGAFDLFVSLLIIAAVVGSLLYLYRVINQQKQLAEIKNDLISNITHEFKTPIATISTAIEGIAMFNQANDPEKTKKYLGISSDQLKKLNTMVEKLLETATLDSDEIELNKESVDAIKMTRDLIEKFDMVKGEKRLSFACDLTERVIEIDPFHMENAISNLIDNALKYGGDQVSVRLGLAGEHTVWSVTDNGRGIEKQQQSHIFDKFYRIPTGNVHNVKGFGIGLYYTKAMVEKHGGTIDLSSKEGETVFAIRI